MDLQSHKNTHAISSNGLAMYLDLKSTKEALKPLCSGYKIWWSLRNWLETKPQSNCLPTSASKVPGASAFGSQTSHCFPGSRPSVGVLAYWPCNRLIVPTDSTSIHSLFPKSSLGERCLGSLSRLISLSSPSFLNSLFISTREDASLNTVAQTGKHLILCLLNQNQWTNHSV